MKILILDRDQLATQMISSRLKDDDTFGDNLHIDEEMVKADAMEKVASEGYDVVMVDPAPLTDAQAIVMNIRRVARKYPYVILMGEDLQPEDVNKVGANNFVNKPLDVQNLKQKISQAQVLLEFGNRLNDLSEDFPSAGGVIAKSAFNQLYLSAIDRGWRYVESAHVLSFTFENYDEILKMDGPHHANYSVSKLAQHLVRLRRQSDVIGQTGANEYSLLLQRTDKANEAVDAAKRFAANIEEINDFIPEEGNAIRLRIRLMELPTGNHDFNQVIMKKNAE